MIGQLVGLGMGQGISGAVLSNTVHKNIQYGPDVAFQLSSLCLKQ